jgi:DNA repair exonuclease SbcCD nuclease subunit
MSFRFVALGDLHLDKLDHLFGTELTNQLLFAEWSKAADYAVKNKIKYLVILGDVADKARLSEEARVVLQKFLYKYDGKLDIRIILGNHDVEYEGYHSLEAIEQLVKEGAFKSVTIYTKPKQVVIGGVPINFLPFPAERAIEYRNQKGKRVQTLNFAHLERPGALRDNGMVIEQDHGVPDDGHDLWVIGHLHTPHEVGNSHYVGTAYQTNFGERLPKGFTVGKVELDGLKLKGEFTRVQNKPAFVLHNLKIESVKDLKKITDNPLDLYKVAVKRGVELPYDLSARHKNIVNTVVQYKTGREADAMLEDAEVQIKFDLTSGLKKQLMGLGLDKPQANRGLAIVEEIQSNI